MLPLNEGPSSAFHQHAESRSRSDCKTDGRVAAATFGAAGAGAAIAAAGGAAFGADARAAGCAAAIESVSKATPIAGITILRLIAGRASSFRIAISRVSRSEGSTIGNAASVGVKG